MGQFEKSAKYLFVKLKSIKNYSHQSREKGLEREIYSNQLSCKSLFLELGACEFVPQLGSTGKVEPWLGLSIRGWTWRVGPACDSRLSTAAAVHRSLRARINCGEQIPSAQVCGH